MTQGKHRIYAEQTFDRLRGLDGISDAQIKPILVMDVWEHAFMRDHAATEKGRYLEAFFRNIDWRIVEHRFEEPMAIRPAAAA